MYKKILFFTALGLLLTACDNNNQRPEDPPLPVKPDDQQQQQQQQTSNDSSFAPQTDDIVINNPQLMALFSENESMPADDNINDVPPPPQFKEKPVEPAVTSESNETQLRIKIAESELKVTDPNVQDSFEESADPVKEATELSTPQPATENLVDPNPTNIDRTPSPILRETYTDKPISQDIKPTKNSDDDLNFDNLPTPVINSQTNTTKPVLPEPTPASAEPPNTTSSVIITPTPDPANATPAKPLNQSEVKQTKQVYADIARLKDEVHSMIYSQEPIEEFDGENVG